MEIENIDKLKEVLTFDFMVYMQWIMLI